MLDCLTAHAHRLRVLIETLLYRFEHVLVFPSRDSPLGPCRTPGFERAARACGRPVAAQRLAILGPSFISRTVEHRQYSRRSARDTRPKAVMRSNEGSTFRKRVRLRSLHFLDPQCWWLRNGRSPT